MVLIGVQYLDLYQVHVSFLLVHTVIIINMIISDSKFLNGRRCLWHSTLESYPLPPHYTAFQQKEHICKHRPIHKVAETALQRENSRPGAVA